MEKLYAEIGGRMRGLRKALRLTQAQISELAGIDASFYGQIERGANIPSLKTFLAIASALKVDPADLLPSSRSLSPAYHKTLGRLLEELPQEKQRFILGMVKDMAEELKASK
ncbi:MAG: helix-turn-helix transcriptional regulator [Elusimicrobia bacterium]|nr:helix-turn-helix transcriptional regulator [Elusimicrobiota bacterium]